MVLVGYIAKGAASIDAGTTKLDSTGGIEGAYCTGAVYLEASGLGDGCLVLDVVAASGASGEATRGGVFQTNCAGSIRHGYDSETASRCAGNLETVGGGCG